MYTVSHVQGKAAHNGYLILYCATPSNAVFLKTLHQTTVLRQFVYACLAGLRHGLWGYGTSEHGAVEAMGRVAVHGAVGALEAVVVHGL